MKMDSLTLIRDLSLLEGISGHEDAVASYIRECLEGIGTVTQDGIGNLICTIEGSDPLRPSLLFAAHMDEIGFLVSDITAEGFLRVQAIGGWNPLSLPASEVDVVHRAGGLVRGVFGLISPHFLSTAEAAHVPSIEDLYVDVGASCPEEVHNLLGIEVGARVIPAGRFTYRQESGTVLSKALDDRIGVASLIELAWRLSDHPVGPTVQLVFSVQEEVGARGAAVLSSYVEADALFVVEGAPADDVPQGVLRPQTALGKGAHVRIFDPTHIASAHLLSHIDAVCEAEGITIQKSVRKGGGTDAARLALSGKGIPAVVVGVPVRYAHSHCGVSSLFDYDELVKLLYAVCEYMN